MREREGGDRERQGEGGGRMCVFVCVYTCLHVHMHTYVCVS